VTTLTTTTAGLPIFVLPTVRPAPALPQDDAGRWQRRDLPPQIASASMIATGPRGTIVFGNYAFGASPGTAGWYSPDGSSWAEIEDLQRMIDGGDRADAGFGWVSAVAAGPGGFVAVGGRAPSADGRHGRSGGAAWTSPDGRVWTRVGDDSAFGMAAPTMLVRGAHEFIAMAEAASDSAGRPTLSPLTAWRSDDGRSWQPTTVDQRGYLVSIAATSFGYVVAAIGASASPHAPAAELPAIWISPDGIDWRRINVDVLSSAPSRIAFVRVVPFGNGAALVGRQFESDNVTDNAMTIVMTSTDGGHWRNITAPPCLTPARRDYIVDFAATTDRFMIVASISDTPVIITGTHDGAEWHCALVDPVAFPTTKWGPPYLSRLTVNPNGSFSIVGGVALETLNKPNYQATIWTEHR
jgi:hypothetical protein